MWIQTFQERFKMVFTKTNKRLNDFYFRFMTAVRAIEILGKFSVILNKTINK